jgi:hypothetical protein
VFTSRKSGKSLILFKAFTAEARVYPVLSISTVLFDCCNIIFEILERVSVADRNAHVVCYIERLKHMGIGINSSWKVEVLRQLYMANLPNNTIITSDQEEEINVVQNTSENVQVTNVPAVTTAASSELDHQRPVVNSAAGLYTHV